MWHPILGFFRHALELSVLWQQRTKMTSDLQSAKRLAVGQDWAAAIRRAEWIVEQPAPRSRLKRWFWIRLIRPIQRETRQHFDYWTIQADAEYDTILKQARWLAFIGQFQGAIERLEPAHQAFFRLEGKQHLEALERVMEYRKSFHLALLAEQSGHWQTATDLYDRLLIGIPEVKRELRFRQAIIAIKTQQWAAATESLKSIAAENVDSLRATALLAYVEKEDQQVIQNNSNRTNLQVLQQAAFEAGQAKNWKICNQTLEQIWAIEGDYPSLQRWSIAAYYCALELPTWHGLETCLSSRNMALANLPEYSTLLPADQIELTTQLKQQTLDLIQALENSELAQYLIRCNAIDELAMAESEDPALYWKTLRVTPMIYRRHSTIASAMPALPNSYLGSLYTDWAEAVLLCQQGKVTEAKLHYPKSSQIPAERYAERYVSYHEGCDYLTIQPGGYLRWREAKQPLYLAQGEIRTSVPWQDQLNALFEAYYPALWEPEARQEFTQFWVDLLNTPTAHSYFQQAHDN
jgi:hypothetical protein